MKLVDFCSLGATIPEGPAVKALDNGHRKKGGTPRSWFQVILRPIKQEALFMEMQILKLSGRTGLKLLGIRAGCGARPSLT